VAFITLSLMDSIFLIRCCGVATGDTAQKCLFMCKRSDLLGFGGDPNRLGVWTFELKLAEACRLARISQTSTGIACRYSTFESEINVLQPFDLQSKEDSLF